MYVREAPDKKLSKRTREFMTIADIQRMKGNYRGLGQNVDLKIIFIKIFRNLSQSKCVQLFPE